MGRDAGRLRRTPRGPGSRWRGHPAMGEWPARQGAAHRGGAARGRPAPFLDRQGAETPAPRRATEMRRKATRRRWLIAARPRLLDEEREILRPPPRRFAVFESISGKYRRIGNAREQE